jgi:propanediol dehydratase small subunit
MANDGVRTRTGKALSELTVEAVLGGQLGIGDFRISAEQLQRQADASERAGYRQLADNLRRAAELTGVSNDELLTIYDMLRPGRASADELLALADRLDSELGARRTAELVREAAEVYRVRGIARSPI